MESFNQGTIGVIVNAHNEENNIENCLKSILEQVNCHFVLCVSDNNSTDSTSKLILDFSPNFENFEFRSESYPLKSVYEHAVNSYEYFLNRYPLINFWIILSADDRWVGPNFLSSLLFASKFDDEDLGYCTYPSIQINSALSPNPKYFTNKLQSNTSLIRRIKYMVTPRSHQPLLFAYGLFNRIGFELLVEWFNDVENYRRNQRYMERRVPEAEIYYSQKLIGKLLLKSSPEAQIEYFIHHRAKHSKDLVENFESKKSEPPWYSIYSTRIRTLSNSIFHMFFSLRKIWNFIELKEKIFYIFLLPANIIIEFIEFSRQHFLSKS